MSTRYGSASDGAAVFRWAADAHGRHQKGCVPVRPLRVGRPALHVVDEQSVLGEHASPWAIR
jgi:hypothetical protein